MNAESPNVTQVPAVSTHGELSEQRAVRWFAATRLGADELVITGVAAMGDLAGAGVDDDSGAPPDAQAATRSVAAMPTAAANP
jgi:hypothetical protein